jgi:hypothetical protein
MYVRSTVAARKKTTRFLPKVHKMTDHAQQSSRVKKQPAPNTNEYRRWWRLVILPIGGTVTPTPPRTNEPCRVDPVIEQDIGGEEKTNEMVL